MVLSPEWETKVEPVRRWAWSRGIPVHTTGYPPKMVILAYNRANPDRAIRLPGVDWISRERIVQASKSGAASRHKKEHA